ncbi:MAG: hypothetical protein QOE14_96, partial [Humisphaera sp.]|nr:hypothetical protein [Humisphaera sp.]
MRTRIALCWAAVALSLVCQISQAQTAATPPPSDQNRLDKLEQRLNQLEADVKSRDEEIARLKSQLTAPQSTQPTGDEIERTKQDVLKDLESRQASPLTLRTPANFN